MRSSPLSAPLALVIAVLVACSDDATDGRPPGSDGGAGAPAGSGGAGGAAGAVSSAGASGAGNGPSAGAAGTSAGTGGTSSPNGGTGGTSSPNGGTGGTSSPNGGTGGAVPPNGGSAGAPSAGSGGSGAGPSAGSGGGGAGGAKVCVGEVDDTEPNDSLATAYDLGTLVPDFADDCGGATPQISFDGSTGPGDPDYAKVVGAEKNVKCSHRPELLVFHKTNVNGCVVAKCDEGTASYTCKGGAGADLGNGYYGCCGDLSKTETIELDGFICSGSKGSAKLVVKISSLPGATTCEPYGVLVMF